MTRRKKSKAIRTPDDVRAFALLYPGAEEAGVCTKAAFKAGKKSFVFLGVKLDTWDVMVKLSNSVPEATELATRHPGRFKVGKAGWTNASFSADAPPTPGLLERWIDESYRLLVPKRLLTHLADQESGHGVVRSPSAVIGLKDSPCRRPLC